MPRGSASALIEPGDWQALAVPSADIPDGAQVALGFDGSHAYDGTALVACSSDGLLSLELLIEREPTDPPEWVVPRDEVHAAVADAFERWEVVRCYCDPYRWRDELEQWASQYGADIVASFPTNSVARFGPAVDRFRTAVRSGTVSHDGDADLGRHVLNAQLVRGRGRTGDDGHVLHTLAKRGHGRLIDAAVASVLALEAMAHARREGLIYEHEGDAA